MGKGEGGREEGNDGEGVMGEAVGEETAGRDGGKVAMVELALGWRERPRHHDLGE